MQFGRALNFPFQDKDWFRKVLVPALWQILPGLGMIAVTGWALEVCRRVIRGTGNELPDFNLRRSLSDGLAVWGIFLVCGIPIFLWLGLGGFFTSPLFLKSGAGNSGTFDLLWWGIECGALVIALGAAVWASAAIGRFADTGSFRAAFRMREIFSVIRSAPAAYLLAVLAGFPLALLAFLGIAICCAGVSFTTAYALASAGHLAGQAYALGAARRASPAETKGRNST